MLSTRMIDGLWPDYNDGTWPSCCTRSSFQPREVLRQDLCTAILDYMSESCSRCMKCTCLPAKLGFVDFRFLDKLVREANRVLMWINKI